jgi:hypothetical protein
MQGLLCDDAGYSSYYFILCVCVSLLSLNLTLPVQLLACEGGLPEPATKSICEINRVSTDRKARKTASVLTDGSRLISIGSFFDQS